MPMPVVTCCRACVLAQASILTLGYEIGVWIVTVSIEVARLQGLLALSPIGSFSNRVEGPCTRAIIVVTHEITLQVSICQRV